MVGAFLVGLVFALQRGWTDFAQAVRELSPAAVLVSLLAGIAANVVVGLSWWGIVRGLGLRAPVTEGARVFFLSQLGKYLPGAIWPVVAQIEFGRRWSLPRRAIIAAYALTVVVLVLSGLLVGATVLAWGSSRLPGQGWLLLLVPILLVVCLNPPWTVRVLDRALVAVGRDATDLEVGRGVLLSGLAWATLVWGLLGVHMILLTGQFSAQLLLVATGAMAFATAAGLVVVPAPAGVGVRDGLLYLVLAPEVGATAALASVVVSRLLLLVSDCVLALVAVVGRGGAGRRAIVTD